jgi:hypothetical protein
MPGDEAKGVKRAKKWRNKMNSSDFLPRDQISSQLESSSSFSSSSPRLLFRCAEMLFNNIHSRANRHRAERDSHFHFTRDGISLLLTSGSNMPLKTQSKCRACNHKIIRNILRLESGLEELTNGEHSCASSLLDELVQSSPAAPSSGTVVHETY